MRNSFLFISMALVAACGDAGTTSVDINHFYAPGAGTIVAADSTPIADDELNELFYRVSITATDSSSDGVYALDAAHGYNEAHTMLIYPKLDREIKPAIRPDSINYSYIVGFYLEGSDTFKDYARVAAKRVGPLNTQIEIKYLKAYFMDSASKK